MIRFTTLLKPISAFLRYRPFFPFTKRAQATKLILRSPGQIQKLHMRRKQINKQWTTIKEETQFKPFKISLIGLPNCGKSTLFNCLIGQNLAIVDKLAGMTRDRRQYGILEGLAKVVDTPGVQVTAFGGKENNVLKQDIFKQTVTALHESNMIFIVLDSKKPITSDEVKLVKYIKTFGKNIDIGLICNKCDGNLNEEEILEEAKLLGIRNIFMCSGTLGTGIFQVLDFIKEKIPKSLQQNLQLRKIERVKKFQMVVNKIKQEMRELQMKGVKIKQWERDFRKINSGPELNEDLDYDNFEDFLIRPEKSFSSERGTEVKNLKVKNSIKICFIGRPNVGKSSLINEILGEDRLVVSEVPHTTRDSIVTKILYKNRKIELIDTAGLNTPNFDKNQQYLKKVQVSTMLHVKQSHVVVYIMDAFSAFKIDDFKLIQSVIKEGRPIIIAVNKWEIMKEEFRYKAKNYLKKQIDQNLGQLHGYPMVFVSAKMGQNLNELMDHIIVTYDKWNSRISTGLLNDWLSRFKKVDNLPKDKQTTLKINFLIQARVRPPHYIFFINNKSMFKDNYCRFLLEKMAKQFSLEGIPLRMTLRSTNNKENKLRDPNKKRKVSPMKMKMEQLKKRYDNFGL